MDCTVVCRFVIEHSSFLHHWDFVIRHFADRRLSTGETQMPVYPCPECGAQLRPANPVAPGKKLRCPKCETVFAVPAAATKEKKKAAQPAPAAAPGRDDDEAGSYGLVSDNDTRTAEERMKS